MATIKLKPDPSLLCPDFDGYKLSSASGLSTSYSKPVPDGLCTSGKNDNSSYLHTRLDALHNCLFVDAAANSSTASELSSYSTVYCFNKRGQLLAYDYSNEMQLCASRAVWQLELSDENPQPPSLLLTAPQHLGVRDNDIDGSNSSNMFGILRPSLVFASSRVAVAADGRRGISIMETGDRRPEAHHTWTTRYYNGEIGACEVVDARIVSHATASVADDSKINASENSETADADASILHVLLVAVAPPTLLPIRPPSHLSSSTSLHLITWLTFITHDGLEYTLERERLYIGGATLEYCQFDRECSSVLLLTHQYFAMLHDSKTPAPAHNGEKTPDDVAGAVDKRKPLYTYQQTEDDVTIQLNPGPGLSSSALSISVQAKSVHVSIRGGEQLLAATFLHAVQPDTATWTVEDGKVEVCVCKAVAGHSWERLLKEEHLLGEEITDSSQVEKATDRLAHLTSGTWGGNSEMEDTPAYNPGQLESCDDADSDLLLLLLDGQVAKSVQDTPKAQLGNTQYLATIQSGDGPAMFCVRHDVDGVVYRVEESRHSNERFSHAATFNAFGYVRAGKTMAKFTTAPSDCNYIAISDVRSHVYLFCQPQPMGGVLKNRVTGKVTSKVSRQLLLSLPCHNEVMGIFALSKVLFVCTDECLYAYALNFGGT
uniref:NudC domain-containing protein 1 n=2 Tax=Hirondellea gigas TaxID=1518452 RepID=A0A2P2I031_9CRUS